MRRGRGFNFFDSLVSFALSGGCGVFEFLFPPSGAPGAWGGRALFVDAERCLVVVVVVVDLAVGVGWEGHPFDLFVELVVPARESFCSFECI